MSEEKTTDFRKTSLDVSPAAPALAPAAANDASPFGASKPARTAGLRLFDIWLYPILTNFAVFFMSVGATYLTNKGMPNADGTLPHGKIGKFFHDRGEYMVGLFQKTGMKRESAEMWKMVFFSFADGTLVAPLVKLFEDRREKIGMWIDERLGTVPPDKSVYTAEPKQTWGSVLEGRALTSAIVVPTALILDKAGLNEKMFGGPGIKTGQWVASRPKLAKHFGKLDIPELFRVSYFEAFYTSVCTAGLYFISRGLARRQDKQLALPQHNAPVTEPMTDEAPLAKRAEHTAPTTQTLGERSNEGRLQAQLEQSASLA